MPFSLTRRTGLTYIPHAYTIDNASEALGYTSFTFDCPTCQRATKVRLASDNISLFYQYSLVEFACPACSTPTYMVTGHGLITDIQNYDLADHAAIAEQGVHKEFLYFYRISCLAALHSFLQHVVRARTTTEFFAFNKNSLDAYVHAVLASCHMFGNKHTQEQILDTMSHMTSNEVIVLPFKEYLGIAQNYFSWPTDDNIRGNTFLFYSTQTTSKGSFVKLLHRSQYNIFIPLLPTLQTKELQQILVPGAAYGTVPCGKLFRAEAVPTEYSKKSIEKGIDCPMCGSFVAKKEAYVGRCPVCGFSFSVVKKDRRIR